MKSLVKNICWIGLAAIALWSCGDDHDLSVGDIPPVETSVCDTDRFSKEVFTEIDSVTVRFADQNFLTQHPTDLFMDIYYPTQDTMSKRPVIIWAFGGGFVQGQRSDMHVLTRNAAKRGYVSATIDYRLLQSFFPPPNEEEILRTVVKASSDMKGAIKFFRLDADTENVYNIDPDQIYVGGISAGAITSLVTGLVDEDDIPSGLLRDLMDENGGINGNSNIDGSEGYSTNVNGIINLSGGVNDLNYIEANDPPIFSVHGDDDQVVPYGFAAVNILGIELIQLYGSSEIYKQSQNVGHEHDFITIEGGGHTDIYVDDSYKTIRDDFVSKGFAFLKDNICE